MLLRLSLVFALMMLSCSRAASCISSSDETDHNYIANTQPRTSSCPHANAPIRAIDFNDVAFPPYPVYIGDRGKKKYITIKPGDGGPALLNYGDVTSDGLEEAMMMLGIENRGSAIPEIVYIFTLQTAPPGQLWHNKALHLTARDSMFIK